MESRSNQTSVKQIQIYFRFALMTALHTLGILSTSFTWKTFPTLEGVPTYAEHLLAAFRSLCGPTHPKPSEDCGGQVI